MASLKRNSAQRRLIRERLFKQQNGKCHWCGGLMLLEKRPHPKPPHPRYATFEHLIPRCCGGSGKIDNVVLAHRICNEKRGANWNPVSEGR